MATAADGEAAKRPQAQWAAVADSLCLCAVADLSVRGGCESKSECVSCVLAMLVLGRAAERRCVCAASHPNGSPCSGSVPLSLSSGSLPIPTHPSAAALVPLFPPSRRLRVFLVLLLLL